jgi:hypothetical protein
MPALPHAIAALDRDQLVTYLDRACAGEPELLATVHTLAEAGEIELLRLMRDFRDNQPDEELLARHGTQAVLNERLRLIHRVYVDCARQVRDATQRPLRARNCYGGRMLARRDNYQAFLDDPGVTLLGPRRLRYQKLVDCAREKVPYEALPARLGQSPADVQEEVLELRLLFKEWTVRRKGLAHSPGKGGLSDG